MYSGKLHLLLVTLYCVLAAAVSVQNEFKIEKHGLNDHVIADHDVNEGLARYFNQQSHHRGRMDGEGERTVNNEVATLDVKFWREFEDDIATRAAAVLEDLEDMTANNTNSTMTNSTADPLAMYQVSDKCLSHTKMFVKALVTGETWALQMIDSIGKPPSGLMGYKFNWVGDWEQCRDVQATVYEHPTAKQGMSHPFVGKYCRIHYPIKLPPGVGDLAAALGGQRGVELMTGMCFADSCSDMDASIMLNVIVGLLPVQITDNLDPVYATCQENHLELTTKAKIALAVLSVFGAIILLGTCVDIYIRVTTPTQNPHTVPVSTGAYAVQHPPKEHSGKNGVTSINGDMTKMENGLNGYNEKNGHVAGYSADRANTAQPYRPGRGGKLLLAFSVISNGEKILSMDQPAGSLTCVNGIRFLSMTWVIMGHSYSMTIGLNDNMAAYVPMVMKRFTFQAILNATFSVDTFFVLSGLLVSYLTLRELKKVGSALKINWAMYYFHRFWRLTPVYAMLILINATLSKYFGDGPFWPQVGLESASNDCENWWTNLLYINNFFGIEKMCMGWSWYLANDMQFYVVSPIFVVALFYSGVFGCLVCLAGLAGTIIASGFISHHYNLPANLVYATDNGVVMSKLYIVPWTRIGPYIVGLFTGYILQRNKCRARIGKVANAVGWLVSTVAALLILYGLYSEDGGDRLKDAPITSAVYNATARTAWGMCVAWVIFACATGHGGPVNVILSWKPLIPLSRLTYCAYLVHLIVLYIVGYSKQKLGHATDLGVASMYLVILVYSYGVAFLVSLAFESPMMGLEKVLLGRRKNS